MSGAALLVVASAATTLFFGQDDRQRVDAPMASPNRSIGRLALASGRHCTAVLVSANQALTAAHCLYRPDGKPDRPLRLDVGYTNGRATAVYHVTGTRVDASVIQALSKPHVELPPLVTSRDVARLSVKLHEGLAQPATPVFAGNTKALRAALRRTDNRISLAGYPTDHPDWQVQHHACPVTALFSNGTLAHRCDVMQGDSGAPLWVWTADGPRIIAIQSSVPATPQREQIDNIAVRVR
ncbi:trypsin-like serine peptidase [Chitinibacteraceae bacterium HSL-7]